MGKKKAVICTILYVLILTIILTASFFVKSELNGITLYQLIVSVIGNMWLGNSVVKFYEWLMR